jgi:hypothetical protein
MKFVFKRHSQGSTHRGMDFDQNKFCVTDQQEFKLEAKIRNFSPMQFETHLDSEWLQLV